MKLIVIKNENDLEDVRNIIDEKLLLFFNNDIKINSFFEPINKEDTDIIMFGNCHYIDGLTINKSKYDNNGLFSKVKNLYVRDLVIKNANIKSGEVCGVLAGNVSENLNAKNVKINCNIHADSIVGAFAGYAENVVINDCEVSGLFMARGIIGALVGMSRTFKAKSNDVHDFHPYVQNKQSNNNVHEDVGYLSSRENKELVKKLNPILNKEKASDYYME